MHEVRICEYCAHKNDVSLLECEECGADISLVIPIDESKLSPSILPWVIETSSGERFSIEDGMILGRLDSPLAEPLNASDYVSRHHAVFHIRDNHLEITDTSTNGTKINGTRINKGAPSILSDGDTIEVGGITLKVNHAN